MTFRTSLRFAVLLPFLFAAGCYINVHDNDHDGPGGPSTQDPDYLPATCQDNSECAADEYCFRGECRDVPDGATACTTTSQCGQREYCINGFCTELCAKNSDCSGNDTTCDQNYCVCPPDNGSADAGTGNGSTDAGTGNGNASCVNHVDCGNGAYCINAVCYLGCQTDNDCPSTESCQSGVCQTKPATQQPACTTGAQCAQGEDCVGGKCSAHCTSNATCPTGYTCTIGYCTVTPPPSGSGQACVANCECPAGETCVNGTCQL